MKINRKIALSAVSVLGMLALSAGPAFAATNATSTTPVSASISGSGDSISVAFPTTFNLALSAAQGARSSWIGIDGLGTSATNTADNLITLDDATGTDAGWTASIQSTALTEVEPSGFSGTWTPLVMPSGSLEVGQVAGVMADSGQTSSDPAPTISTLSGGFAAIDGSKPVTIASAASGGGAGTWGLQWAKSEPMLMAVASNNAQYVDTKNYPSAPTPYSATITVTMVEN